MNKPVGALAPEAEFETITAPHVLVAMNAVMEDIGKVGIAKDRRNKEQGYQFRGIDDIYEALNPILARHRLLVFPVKMAPTYDVRPSRSGGSLFVTKVVADFKLASAVDGSFEIIQTIGEAMDSADKASNKCLSAAMKYAELMVFQIPTEGDNDADATTPEVASLEERAVAHLRACSTDKALFKDAWEKNKDGWKSTLERPAYARLVKVMQEIAAKFPKEPEAPPPSAPPADERPTEQFQLDDEIPF